MGTLPTAADIAACGGMAPDTRRRWVEVHGLLASESLGEYDAIETAVVATLSRSTTSQRARATFQELRGPIREAVLAGHDDLWVVVGAKLGAVLAVSAAEAATKAGGMDGLVWLVDVSSSVASARQRYSQLALGRGAEVHRLFGAAHGE